MNQRKCMENRKLLEINGIAVVLGHADSTPEKFENATVGSTDTLIRHKMGAFQKHVSNQRT